MRHKEGVKIYFDPVSTAAREESARDLAANVLADPSKKDCINTVRPCVHACCLKLSPEQTWHLPSCFITTWVLLQLGENFHATQPERPLPSDDIMMLEPGGYV